MKKDYNYIAAVEKAIAEKYGKDTVQDFRSEWKEEDEKDYLKQLRDRKKAKASSGKTRTLVAEDVEIIKRKKSKKEERTCPVCKTYSFLFRDDLYMNRFKCCFSCYLDFVEFREDEWESGVRPSEDDISKALRRRKKNVKYT